MRIVATNAHKNPVVFDVPWLYAEDEEVHVGLQYDERSKKGEAIQVAVPRAIGHTPREDIGDPQQIVVVGLERSALEEGKAEFYIDICREDSGPDRIYSLEIRGVDD